MTGKKVKENPWVNKPYIKIDFKEEDQVLIEDGLAVNMCEELEVENSNKLLNSLVIKVFGKEILAHMVAWEVRRQWSMFGKFHFTSLVKGWFLFALGSTDSMEAILSGGPWFVNGNIISMEKWSPEFSPLSMKGLTSPIWVRMPHLPLHCWDEKNIARIASMIGKPLMMDGNIFQWGRREFVRVCVRIKIDQCLPLGVWVESISGRFFQKVEYEKISSFCFQCGMIGHVKGECIKKTLVQENVKVSNFNDGLASESEKRTEEVVAPNYGQWFLVNHKRNRRKAKINNLPKQNVKYVKKNPMLQNNKDAEKSSDQKDLSVQGNGIENLVNADETQLEEGEFVREQNHVNNIHLDLNGKTDEMVATKVRKPEAVLSKKLNSDCSILVTNCNKFEIMGMDNEILMEEEVQERNVVNDKSLFINSLVGIKLNESVNETEDNVCDRTDFKYSKSNAVNGDSNKVMLAKELMSLGPIKMQLVEE
ncbi:uncharacterized protein LOC110109514 [Dendrobium catenatum]|uniref:uncharacterized protein LOC110109514 n=1 Tax=Dendrobium catenatum TaxID=906689 RepID=UPI0009F61F5D|nr:uncharacterized protein LOC110109514 [Dendrobium catenatum]